MLTVSTLNSGAATKRYHHGDLRTALIDAARTILINNQPFSLRAVATAVGVSPTATYRHFADRSALEAAIAAQGFRELYTQLQQAGDAITTAEEMWKIASTYVDWAVNNQTIFRLMCTTAFHPDVPEKNQIVTEIMDFIRAQLHQWYPERAGDALFTGVWALTHGLATLYLENKLDITDSEELHQHIQQVWTTIFHT